MQAIELRRRVREMGNQFNPAVIQQSIALYASIVRDKPWPAARVQRDVQYGNDARHRLDIFVPETGAAGRPVLIFVHGGGFIGGDKGVPDAPFYNNVGYWAVAQGYVGVTMTYRLAPQHPWPAGAQDVAAAIAWLREHIGTRGGDPHSLFLMGQSAGAAHVAGYLANPRLHGSEGEGLAGALLISGIYDLNSADRNDFLFAYFGRDESRYAAMSTLEGLLASNVPWLCSVSEFDAFDFMQQAALLTSTSMIRRRNLPRLLYLTNHNHITSVLQIGTPFDSLGTEIRTMIEDHRRA